MLIARLITVEEANQLALRIEKQLANATGKKVMPMDMKSGHTTSVFRRNDNNHHMTNQGAQC